MREVDVRAALVHTVARRMGERPHVLVPEVEVRGNIPARVDALLVAHRIHGFEIKSDVDSLTRLPRQVAAYSAVVENATLVVGERHLHAATALLPPWWRIWLARWRGDVVTIRQVRGGSLNPDINPVAVTSFMSREELLVSLRGRGYERLSTQTVDQLRQLLFYSAGARETVRVARGHMLARQDWRSRSLLPVN